MEPGAPQKDDVASSKVKSIEARTGQKRLFSYVLNHKPAIMAELEQAKSWRERHAIFLKCGLLLKASANGLAIKDRIGKHHVKPSAI